MAERYNHARLITFDRFAIGFPTSYGQKSKVGQVQANPESEPPSDDSQALRASESLMYSRWFVPAVLAALVLAMFGNLLLLPGDRVLSMFGLDTSNIFVYWRQFWLEQVRAGHFPLWNPHVYSGLPFLGCFESAMLYPPNWILYFTLPLAKAIDYEFALHIFLMGLFTAWWAEHYGLHPVAALLAAGGAMFCTPFFGGVLAGHLPHIDSMAWAPLILLSIDSLADQPGVKWVLIGMFAFSMQAFAGYPQVLFTTIVSGGIFGALRLLSARRPVMTVAAVLIVGAGAAMISAAQLWTGLQAAGEGLRWGGTSFAFASSFSLTYDNLLAVLVPNFFGGGSQLFWGGNGAVPFFGLVGLLLAAFGMRVRSPHRGAFIATAAAILLIAMGRYTPLFGLLYRFVPGFDLFRRPSVFSFAFVIFMAMLSGFGMDALIRSPGGTKRAGILVVILGLVLGAFGAVARYSASAGFDAMWRGLVHVVMDYSEHLFPPQIFEDPAFMEQAKHFAGGQCLIAAGICMVAAALLLLRTKLAWAAYALAVLAIAEIFVFARPGVFSFDLAQTVPAGEKEFIAAHPGDYRILNPGVNGFLALSIANSAVAVGADDIWGYDPTVSKRYAEFLTYSQGGKADDADMVIGFSRVSPMWRILRLRYVLNLQQPQVAQPFRNGIIQTGGDLPHVLLVDRWQRLEHRDEILRALRSPIFDGSTTAILESDPVPAPMHGGESGTVQLVDAGTDALTIAADVPQATLLLITDSYSKYWRAVALKGSSQSEYHVMPADYTIMAVPIGAGHHLLRLEYAPSGWVIGRWISLVSLLLYIAAIIWWRSGARGSKSE